MAIGFRKRGLFGSKMGAPIETPGIGDDIQRQRMGMPDMAPGLGMQAEQPKQGRGSFLPYALAAVEDTLSRQMGYAPQGVARINAQQAAQQQAIADQAAEMRKRSLDMSDYRTKKQIDQEYRGPDEGPAIAQNYNFIRGIVGDEAAKEYVANYGQRPEEPRMISIPGKGTFFGTMPEVMQWAQGGSAQQGSPYNPDEWDVVEGGPTASQSGGFRP